MLNREAILAAEDLRSVDVDVPEWGGTIRVRMLTGAEMDQFMATVQQHQVNGKIDPKTLRARLVILTAVDEDGARLFTDDDLDALQGKSHAAIARVFGEAQHLNGLSDDDVEEMAGN